MNNTEFDKLLKSLPEKLATIEQIKALEQKLNIHLSAEQTEFLLSYQGAHFQLCDLPEYMGYFAYFYSVDEIEYEYNSYIPNTIEVEWNAFCHTGHLLPIAHTNIFSVYVCLSISPVFEKGVWCMDFEIDETIESKARTYHIANSIDEFLTICADNVCE
ncbi:SMI1/KNR4 family protein [Fibrisoma limi]|uniref:SMI1/KNR4 family protein n=1 Tax=Fibrisoma limi TaxID=663275 RepID=UPI000587B454|nr:SMI1/KNR4 family protein [Fibrisoma limi]